MAGSINHEMVILPLPASQSVGARPTGADAKADEAGSLGEASNANGKGAGQGVVPRRLELDDRQLGARTI
jgi:hypothetical protein